MTTEYASTVVVGLGKTGYSCARFLEARGVDFMLVDTRDEPPYLERLLSEQPQRKVLLGKLNEEVLMQAEQLVVSPGIAVSHPSIAAALAAGARLRSDIDLFCETVSAPIIAITGSNAKSTVTTLVGLMAQQAGKKVGVGGNLGTPVLDLAEQAAGREQDPRELYVLELSSFQLEITEQLKAEVATILNLSPDHLDRYADYEEYRKAKQRIYRGCSHVVVNSDDPQTHPLLPPGVPVTRFGLTEPAQGEFGLVHDQRESYLAFGEEILLPVRELKIRGQHNVSNALAALALGHAAGLAMSDMIAALREFGGLPHRCQWLCEVGGVNYYNDSKGTNVGATAAAIEGIGALQPGKVVLIAGGEAKGADFEELIVPVSNYCRGVVLVGVDADRIADALAAIEGENLAMVRAGSMQQAVLKAAALARPGDVVLLSPACASFDMFDNFEARGDAFSAAVREL